MLEKLKSRKFWMAVISAALIVANEGLDLNIPKDAVMTLAAVVISYILGQSYVDAQK